MNPHFFHSSFFLCFRFSDEDGIPVSQPSPLGEGAPQGRVG